MDDTIAAGEVGGPASTSGIPRVIAGRYRVVSLLGEGGMGRVYRAHDAELDEEVAIKMLRKDVLDVPGILDRFRLEVKLARRVTHPNVARTFDIGEHEGQRFLTMEFVEGEPLSVVAKREGPMAPQRVIEIGSAICAGMAAAHDAGVIHRDLKPDNAIISAEGRVVITDFGVARARADAASRVSTGGLVGTLAYMAPEQLGGRDDIDARVDLFAFGVILFELLTGRRAFPGRTLMEIMQARTERPPPDPREVRADVPEFLADVVVRCMAVDRDQRFASAKELAIALIEADEDIAAQVGRKEVSQEPMQRWFAAPAARRAALEVWGAKGVAAIEARLPPEVRPWFAEGALPREWMPARHFITWMYAAFEGPAEHDLDTTKAYVRRIFDLSYGVVRRFILHMARPEDVIPRLPKLWRQDHTAGEMTVEVRKRGAVIRLSNSPYTQTVYTRAGMAENYRYALSLTRAQNVVEWHALESEGVLVMWFQWK